MDMIERVRADNPGPMTLTGTNTWLVAGPTGTVVADPGPDLPEHLERILAAAGTIGAIVLTHRHHDHSDLAGPLATRTAAPVLAADAQLCRGASPSDPRARRGALAAGAQLPGGLRVLTTPGHTDDSICLWHPASRSLLTGDTVLGQGSSVIAYPEGEVAASLASLTALVDFAEQHDVQQLLPGHGEVVTEPVVRLRHDLAHRHERIDQVKAAVATGHRTVAEVTAVVHAGLDERLVGAARASIAAHLAHLEALDDTDPWLAGRAR